MGISVNGLRPRANRVEEPPSRRSSVLPLGRTLSTARRPQLLAREVCDRTKSLVHGLRIWKDLGHVGVEQNQVRSGDRAPIILAVDRTF